MVIKAPRNHTSIYFTDYLKNESNWKKFIQLQNAKGFTSFNGYANNLFTTDLHENYAKYMHQKHVEPKKRMDIYNDSKTDIREKLNSYSDGELLDLLNISTDFRNTLIREHKRRGNKL